MVHKYKLNDRYISDLKPQAKPYLIWDLEQDRLAVQVQSSGAKSYKVIYNYKGRTQWYHLAKSNAIKVAQARKLANDIVHQVVQGKGDPVADRKANRHADTFEDLAKQYAKYAEKKNKSWKSTDKLDQKVRLPKNRGGPKPWDREEDE